MPAYPPALHVAAALLALLLGAGCANFRHLASDLKTLEGDYRIVGTIRNADTAARTAPVIAGVAEWDPASGKVFSADAITLTTGGTFGFFVKSPLRQYAFAFADENRSGRYDAGEPCWLSTDLQGKPAPVPLDAPQREVRVEGTLSRATRIPPALRTAIDRALAGLTAAQFIQHRGVRFAIGEKADLDDPRFAATRGEDGLWTPATLAIRSGFGIYFLEAYDPARIPVLFIHGAAGSPQDWRPAMERLDRRRYQTWFYFYPSGGRLDHAAQALDEGVEQLHQRYRFQRLHVVAHSMGGLVARDFVVRNAVLAHRPYIRTLITASTPWNGHEAAGMGVRWAPAVVPSWYDMKQGSPFLAHLYDHRLKGRVNHHLLYSHRAHRSAILPAENDGTVSVASELRPDAVRDATSVRGYPETHVSILSSPRMLRDLGALLDASP